MPVRPEVKDRARALKGEPLYDDAVLFLKERATTELLNAKTPEEREEKWRDYHAFARVAGLIAKWAAEAKTHHK